MRSIGERIAKLRKQCGLTQEQLAELLQCSVQKEDDWESGGKEPDLESLLRLADIFHVSTDELLGRPAPYAQYGVSAAGSGSPPMYSAAQMPAQSGGAPLPGDPGAESAAPFVSASAGRGSGLRRQLGGTECALVVLLIVCSGAMFFGYLFSLFSSFGVLPQIFTSFFGTIAAVAGIAAAVLFFLVKAPAASVTARVLFFGGFALAAAFSAVFLFVGTASQFDFIGSNLIILGGVLMAVCGAAFLFRGNGRLRALRIPACLVVSIGAVCEAFALFFPVRGLVLFGEVWQFLYIGVPWCLYFAGERRDGRDYAEENAVRRRIWWRKNRGAVLPVAALLCFAVMLGIFSIAFSSIAASVREDGVLPRIALVCDILICILPPIVFCLYFWLLKAGGGSRAAHWVSFSLWAVFFILAGICNFTDFAYYEPLWGIVLAENIVVALAMFSLFVWTVFLFPDKRGGAYCLAVRIVFCFLATAGTAVGLWFVLANSIEGGTMYFIWFYVLLLFALSFFKGDSRQRNML